MSEQKLTPDAWAEWIAYQCARLGHPAWTASWRPVRCYCRAKTWGAA